MSANQWEVVTKSRKHKNLEKKVETHTEKKRLAAIPIRLDEILPTQQYRSLISGKAGVNAAGGSPTKSSGSGNSLKSKSPKKAVKTNAATAAGKETEAVKKLPKAPPKPKSPEAALRQITPEEFRAHLEHLMVTFPGSELLWLKGVASFLNTKLPFECDPTFTSKSVHYPSNLLSPKLTIALVNFLESMGTSNLAYFYHTLLTSMAMELAKNQTIFGYKLILQLIGKNWPDICSNTMAKTALLRNSYQNRSNVCLSILWAVGQCGFDHPMDGVKVWQNLMLPNLELKSYTKYVAEYIENVLHSAMDQPLSFNQHDFFLTYYTLKANYSGVSREHQYTLKAASEMFLQRYIASSTKHSNLFLTLFREIEHPINNRIEAVASINCLQRSDDCFKVWKMNYKKQLMPTILLLSIIDEEWDNYAAQLRNMKAFHEFLLDAQSINMELDVAKRRDVNLDELIVVVNQIQEKSTQQKKKQAAAEQKCKKCGCCKWILGSIFLIALIGGVLSYDTAVNGKGVFAKSATGKVLQNAGLLPHVEKAWYTTMSASARGYKWAEQHVPPFAKPAIKLSCDLFKLTRNALCNAFSAARTFVEAKLPVAAKFLEQYVPGLPKKIENTSVEVKKVAVDVFAKGVAFFKTQVLVGRFSPENLSKALNETQNLAAEYFSLFHKKVDAYAKLK